MESQILPEIDPGRCDGCGRCVVVCRAGALAVANGKVILQWPERCRWDSDCEMVCPAGAIQVPYAIVFASMDVES